MCDVTQAKRQTYFFFPLKIQTRLSFVSSESTHAARPGERDDARPRWSRAPRISRVQGSRIAGASLPAPLYVFAFLPHHREPSTSSIILWERRGALSPVTRIATLPSFPRLVPSASRSVSGLSSLSLYPAPTPVSAVDFSPQPDRRPRRTRPRRGTSSQRCRGQRRRGGWSRDVVSIVVFVRCRRR